MTDILKRLRTALGDRYEIEREVGAGGMATVYSAQDLRHERKVALKVLRPGLAATVGPERFLREIKTTAGLSHPHIVPLHDSGEADGFLYYVMPYIEGESLRDRLQREGQLPLDEALEITCEVADALSYAHSLGVIHRDVKPENILLEGGHAVVTDFGIARAVAVVEVERLTGTGLAVGTPSYMSPEQAGGEERIDGRSDVYSLACVLYEMLAGEAPYTGPTPQAILARQITGEVRSLQPVRTSVGPDLDAAILRGLSPAPADRQATVTEFAKAVAPRAFAPLGRRSVQTIFARRPLRLAFTYLAVLAVVVAAIAGSLVLLRVREVAAGERPVTLAIYPFRATGPEAGTLGEGVADLLAAAIDGTVGMAVSDPTGLWRALRSGGESPRVPEIDEAAVLTQATGAPAMVLGSLTAVAGRIDVNARIYDAGGTLKATVSASTPAESLPYAVDRLAIDVVAQLWERDTLPTVPVIEGFATQSIDALQAYLEAKSLKRRGLYERAETAVRQAVEFDSTFALAHMELFDVRSWNLYLNARPFTGLTEIIDRAMRHRERLTPRNRLRVEAYKAMDETNGARAASRLERIIQIDSLDIDALHALAFVYLRDGWQMGKGLDDVIAAYRHAVAVDSGSIVGHAMLSWLAVVANDPTGVERSLERLRSLDTLSPFIRGQLGVHRAVQALPAERGAVLRELAGAPVPEVFTALRGLRALRPQLAERFVAELLVDTMPVFHHRIGMGARTQLWMAEGKIIAADSVLRSGELDRIRPTVNRFFVAAALLGVGDSLAAARAAGELAAYAPADSLEAYQDRRPDSWATSWAVGAYEATFGDTASARVWQRAIADLPRGETPWDWTAALAADIEARLAVRGGNVDIAEFEAQRAYELWELHSNYVGEGDPEPAMRFHLAEILRARGESERAAALFRSFTQPHTWMGFYTARAAYEAGEIAQAAGRREEAVRYYQAAERLWEGGEPAVVGAWLDRVRVGLAQSGAR